MNWQKATVLIFTRVVFLLGSAWCSFPRSEKEIVFISKLYLKKL